MGEILNLVIPLCNSQLSEEQINQVNNESVIEKIKYVFLL